MKITTIFLLGVIVLTNCFAQQDSQDPRYSRPKPEEEKPDLIILPEMKLREQKFDAFKGGERTDIVPYTKTLPRNEED